jgi:hypothetical protein
MKNYQKQYFVTATAVESLRVSRHGIAKSLGGRVLAKQEFCYPHTPIHIALATMGQDYPGAKLTLSGEAIVPQE